MAVKRRRHRPSNDGDDGDGTAAVRDLEPQRPWSQRTITLLHDRKATEQVCRDWQDHGWLIMAIDEAPDHGPHPVHVVRVAVPPPGRLPEPPDDNGIGDDRGLDYR